MERPRRSFWIAATCVLFGAMVAVGCGPERPSLGEAALPPACSAEGHRARVDADGLSSAIAERQAQIVDAATSCDYRRLDRIARRDGLVATFDGDRVAPGEWAELEHDGLEVMRTLVDLFTLSPRRAGGEVTWPGAVEWRRLADGSPADQEAIRQIDDGSGLFAWSPDGEYLGWRTTLTQDGRWVHLSLGAPMDVAAG